MIYRIGNKSNLSNKIIDYFPKHQTYIEPFFGAGGMFFNKPKAKYNILNDLDEDIYGLFMVLIDNKKTKELKNLLENIPPHAEILNYFKSRKFSSLSIKNAFKTIYLSNYTFLSKGTTLSTDATSNKQQLTINSIHRTTEMLRNCIFKNEDFEKFINGISYRTEQNRKDTFCYADPPYLETSNNYQTPLFNEWDLRRLIHTLKLNRIKFAISEFNTDKVLEIARETKLKVIEIGERRNITNKRTEIIMVNYEVSTQPTLF